MAKFTIFCLVCIVVAVSSLTSCSAARGLPPSMRSDKMKSSETTISNSKPTYVVDDVDSAKATASSTTTESKSDWEELSEEEFGSCMEDAEIDNEESSSASEVERPCRRMLPDYGNPSANHNKKGP